MKKLLLATAAVVVLSGAGFSQMMGGMMGQQGGMMGQPYGYYPSMGGMGMMPMMHGMMGMGGMMPGMMGMGGMGMMGMMQDPETMKLVQEHMMKCRKELMQKLAKRHNVMAERMLRMMTMHPDAFKEAIKKNPELKKKLKELLK